MVTPELMSRQRLAYKSQLLQQWQIVALENVPGWTWNVYADSWTSCFNNVEGWLVRKGQLPSRYSADSEEVSLGGWAKRQYEGYAGTKANHSPLTNPAVETLSWCGRDGCFRSPGACPPVLLITTGIAGASAGLVSF